MPSLSTVPQMREQAASTSRWNGSLIPELVNLYHSNAARIV